MLSVVSDKRKHKCLSQPWRAYRVKVRSQERSILTIQEKNVSWQLATYAQHKILEMEEFFLKYSVCNAFLQLNTNGQQPPVHFTPNCSQLLCWKSIPSLRAEIYRGSGGELHCCLMGLLASYIKVSSRVSIHTLFLPLARRNANSKG